MTGWRRAPWTCCSRGFCVRQARWPRERPRYCGPCLEALVDAAVTLAADPRVLWEPVVRFAGHPVSAADYEDRL